MEHESPPQIAVLLTAFNGMRWIDEQVESIFNQEGVSVTIFISVDLSTDGTYEWAKGLESKHQNVVLLPYGERFGGAGPNFIRLIKDAELSDFDAVSFADQDDIWLPQKLVTAYAEIESGRCDVYSSNVTAFWADGREVLINKSQGKRKLDHFFEAAGPGCTYVFSRCAMQDFKGFIVKSGEKIKKISLHDWLAYAFICEQGYTWYIDDWPSMRYRQHNNNQVGTNNSITAYKKRFVMIKNKWLRSQINMIVSLVAPEKYVKLNSRIYLILNFTQLRRSFRDRYFLLAMILSGIY